MKFHLLKIHLSSELYTKSGFIGGLITRPDRDLVRCGVESAGLALAVSSLDFLCNSFS